MRDAPFLRGEPAADQAAIQKADGNLYGVQIGKGARQSQPVSERYRLDRIVRHDRLLPPVEAWWDLAKPSRRATTVAPEQGEPDECQDCDVTAVGGRVLRYRSDAPAVAIIAFDRRLDGLRGRRFDPALVHRSGAAGLALGRHHPAQPHSRPSFPGPFTQPAGRRLPDLHQRGATAPLPPPPRRRAPPIRKLPRGLDGSLLSRGDVVPGAAGVLLAVLPHHHRPLLAARHALRLETRAGRSRGLLHPGRRSLARRRDRVARARGRVPARALGRDDALLAGDQLDAARGLYL